MRGSKLAKQGWWARLHGSRLHGEPLQGAGVIMHACIHKHRMRCHTFVNAWAPQDKMRVPVCGAVAWTAARQLTM